MLDWFDPHPVLSSRTVSSNLPQIVWKNGDYKIQQHNIYGFKYNACLVVALITSHVTLYAQTNRGEQDNACNRGQSHVTALKVESPFYIPKISTTLSQIKII